MIAPGIVSGTAAPTSGRTSFGGKSPLTGGIKESNAGGLSSQQLARLGIKALVVEGRPNEAGQWWMLKITKDGAQLAPAGDLAGKGMYEVNRILWERHGEDVAVIGIGPAGEQRLCGAGISVNDGDNGASRYAGRGGLRAVMGSMKERRTGSILIQENGSATRLEDFLPMIEANGLALIGSFKATPISWLRCLREGRRFKYARPSQYYYVWSRAAQ